MILRVRKISLVCALALVGCAYGEDSNKKNAASSEFCYVPSRLELVSDSGEPVEGVTVEACRNENGDVVNVTIEEETHRLISKVYHVGGVPHFTFSRSRVADYLFVAYGYDVMEGEGLWDYELYDVSSGELCTVGQTVFKPDIYPYIDECIDSAS